MRCGRDWLIFSKDNGRLRGVSQSIKLDSANGELYNICKLDENQAAGKISFPAVFICRFERRVCQRVR